MAEHSFSTTAFTAHVQPIRSKKKECGDKLRKMPRIFQWKFIMLSSPLTP